MKMIVSCRVGRNAFNTPPTKVTLPCCINHHHHPIIFTLNCVRNNRETNNELPSLISLIIMQMNWSWGLQLLHVPAHPNRAPLSSSFTFIVSHENLLCIYVFNRRRKKSKLPVSNLPLYEYIYFSWTSSSKNDGEEKKIIKQDHGTHPSLKTMDKKRNGLLMIKNNH